jgi:formylglycine-generating enzyme required for sulfatase activity
MGWFGQSRLIEPQMIAIKPGQFTMGSPDSEPGHNADEGPQHNVVIDYRFAVGKYPVTFLEWDSAARLGACDGYMPSDHGWGRNWRPVINVSWDDVQAYLRFLNERTGKAYRLLSEAEWEYCCRAGTTTAYAFGDRLTTRSQGVVFAYTKTVPVNRLWANRWGLVSMHGNVWEWTEDCWNETYVGAPSDGSAWRSGDCSRRVLRGGSWDSLPQSLRSASRIRIIPSGRVYYIGFRVARTL